MRKQLLDYQKKQYSHTICLSMHTLKVNILESSVTISIKFDHGRKIVFNILIAFIKTVINKKMCGSKSAVIFESKKTNTLFVPKNVSCILLYTEISPQLKCILWTLSWEKNKKRETENRLQRKLQITSWMSFHNEKRVLLIAKHLSTFFRLISNMHHKFR